MKFFLHIQQGLNSLMMNAVFVYYSKFLYIQRLHFWLLPLFQNCHLLIILFLMSCRKTPLMHCHKGSQLCSCLKLHLFPLLHSDIFYLYTVNLCLYGLLSLLNPFLLLYAFNTSSSSIFPETCHPTTFLVHISKKLAKYIYLFYNGIQVMSPTHISFFLSDLKF